MSPAKTYISSEFKTVLSVVIKNHIGYKVDFAKIPDTLEEVRQILDKAGYIATFEIAFGLYLAFKEFKPLLLEGEAGAGKTFLAKSVSEALKFPLFRIQCYEGITFESIVGHWNFQKQLLAIRSGKKEADIYTEGFFKKGRLLELFAGEGNDNVLLIDEFDKSDTEFENYFLEYLDERQVTVPELGTVDQKNKTYVFLTSNQMRNFSEPILRRCLYLYIDYPDKETEFRIIKINIPEAENEIVRQVVELVRILREYDLEKKPSPTEAIEFVEAMLKIEAPSLTETVLRNLLSLVIKTKDDRNFILQNISKIIEDIYEELEKGELPETLPPVTEEEKPSPEEEKPSPEEEKPSPEEEKPSPIKPRW